MALIALVASTYPVLFCGRSFVSPSTGGVPMLYASPPYLPGQPVEELEGARGSDLGALMWQHVSYTFIEHRAIFRDHELPLWNRHNAAGRPLIGQGMSMLSDPLHWIPLLAGGEAWAWDVKFVVAKFLFIWGIGLTVLAVTGFLPAALVMTMFAAFTGLFAARINHPAIFAVCYAPWVFLPMVRLCDTQSRLRRLGWALVLAVAGQALINCGTVKEAYLMLIVMGGAGFLFCLLSPLTGRQKWYLCAALLLCGVGLGLFTFIWWGTFLDSLSRAVTAYDIPGATTLKPGFFLALFDRDFVTKMVGYENITVVPTNILVLCALAWAVVRIDLGVRNPAFIAIGGMSLLLLAGMFQIIPPGLLLKIPFLRNVIHIEQTFSHLLIPLLLIFGGFGVCAFWRTCEAGGRIPFIGYFVFIVLVFAAYFIQLDASGVRHSEKLISFPTLLLIFLVAAPPLMRRMIRKMRWNRLAIGLVLVLSLLVVGSYGMHIETGIPEIDRILLNPKHRPSFTAASPAIAQLKSKMSEPARIMGPDYDVFPGFQGVIDLEGISGADPLEIKLYREFLEGMGLKFTNWGWLEQVSRADLSPVGSLLDILNVRYLALRTHSGANDCPDGTPIVNADLLICERATAWPRAFFTDRIQKYRTLEDLRLLADSSRGHPFAALLASDPAAQELSLGISGSVTGKISVAAYDYRMTENSTHFTVTAPGPGIIVLMETDEMGQFRVTVNDQPRSYFRVNHAFKGIPVSQSGQYRVSVTFSPSIEKWYGPTLGLGAAILLVAIFALASLRVKPEGQENSVSVV